MKLLFKIAGVIFLIILIRGNVYAQKFHFRHYQVDDGLSENTVRAILQDSKGFMWFGTKDGLNRFDGHQYKIYRNNPAIQGTLGNNFIYSLYESENGHIWVGTDGGLYILDLSMDTFSAFSHQTPDGVTVSSAVYSLCSDKYGNLWIATEKQDLFKYSFADSSLKQYPKGESGFFSATDQLWHVYSDASGTIWVGGRQGLARYNRETDSFLTYKIASDNRIESDVLCIFEDSDGDLWLGTWAEGLVRMNRQRETFKHYYGGKDTPYITHIRSIFEYEKDKMMIGGDDGLYIFNKSEGSCQRIDEPLNPQSLSDQNVYAMCRDSNNGVWIGTYFGGVNYISPISHAIEHYYPMGTAASLSGKAISQFCEGEKGNIWIATEDGGLNYLDISTKTITSYRGKGYNSGLSYFNLHSLLIDNDKLWVGTFSRGIDILDLKTNKLSNYSHNKNDENSVNDDCIFAMYRDKAGIIYIGTPRGLDVFDRKKQSFTHIKEVETFVYDIQEDHLGQLWVASYRDGLYCYNPKNQSWKNYRHNPSDPNSICFNKMVDVYLDGQQRLWFASEGGGICKYNYETDDFMVINESHGLPNNVIYGILDDKFGHLWVSSNYGITHIDPVTLTIKNYTKADGLQGNQFNYRSSLKSRDGLLYFGGINGFNVIHPERFSRNYTSAPVIITGIDHFGNEHLKDTTLLSSIHKGIYEQKEVRLTSNQASFRINYTGLNYHAPEKSQYAYRMDGLDNDWISIGKQRYVSYINLPPGNYTFRIREDITPSDNDNYNEDWLQITVLPPYWKSTLAKIIYVITVILAASYLILRYSRSIKRKEKLSMEAFAHKKEKEAYDSKITFFTNIAHEIRTPLSLINAPLECVIESEENSAEMQENLVTVKKNTNRLLDLVNQLMDFRRVEEQMYQIQFTRTNVNALVEELCVRFRASAEQLGIRLELDMPDSNIIAEIDKEGITKVLSNLVNNGLKYGKNLIRLSLSKDEEDRTGYFALRVADDGAGVPEEFRRQIFEPFYQIGQDEVSERKAGAGIGLALSRQLVELHNGIIEVGASEYGGACFTVQVPLKQKDVKEANATQSTETIKKKQDRGEERFHKSIKNILIVEDNAELLTFLEKNLRREFNIITAVNGKKAFDIMREQSIDIVVSDIMMPEMNGLELSAIIKQDPDYCHISVILLSAKTNVETKVEGFECGADIYIEKPFSISVLRAQIDSLIRNRQMILEQFSRSPFTHHGTIANKKNETFLNQLNDEINKNLSDVDFNVDKLSLTLFMSRSNLQRKIKGISGLSPNDYIRLIRLKKAAQLLMEGEYRINEICFIVGFNTPSYFAKCFREQFGILPKDFIKNNENN